VEGLEAAVGEIFAGAAPVRIEHRPYGFRTSFPIAKVDVRFADGTTVRLLAKNVSREGLDHTGLSAKPESIYDGRREIDVYERILAGSALGTPAYHGSAGSWLLLEEVAGVELWQVGEIELWEEAARWLSRMHERLRDARSPHLLAYDEQFLHAWLERAQAFVGGAVLRRVAARYGELVDALVALPRTFIHGEFYASNVLVAPTDGGVRISAVDWEMAGVGPGLLDLAALTSGGWSEDVVYRLAAAYEGQARQPSHRLLEALDLCRLHLAVQWLGWSASWSPPAEHAQDWLGELARLADKLDL
jgi:Phosphotransferase enzyme family